MKNRVIIIILAVLLALSCGCLLWICCFGGYQMFYCTFLQSPNHIYTMETGILQNQTDFRSGSDLSLQYDFDAPEYMQLRSGYSVEEIAGSGSEFEKARNLMNEFSGRLKHSPDFPDNVPLTASDLLAYSLDDPSHGINCMCKAQILNEMLLSLGIYSRTVWLEPNSVYDTECHVVNEVYDSTYNKWIMLDITFNMYWVDEQKTPLSILEIRENAARQIFCTPVNAGEPLSDLNKSLKKHYGTFLYILKNLCALKYCNVYSAGLTDGFSMLCPINNSPEKYSMENNLISEAAVRALPGQK